MNSSRLLLAVSPLLLMPFAARSADMAEVFSDKGGLFVRAGSKQGVTVGSELELTSDAQGKQPAGHGTVLEVWPSMARLSPDQSAVKAKPGFAAIKPEPTSSTQAPLAAKAASPGKRPVLQGHADKGAARLRIFNDSDTAWTNCQLRLNDQRTYVMEHIEAQGDDGVMLFKLHGPPTPPMDSLTVTCDEGESTFSYSNPRGPGALRGHVEHGHMGRVIVFNDSNRDWHRCVMRQPDGSQYFQRQLDGHSDDGIMPGHFEKNGPPLTEVAVECDQGAATFKL